MNELMKHIAAGHSDLRNRSLLRNQHNMDLSLLQGINYIELIQPASTRAVVAVSILHRNAECECLSCCGLWFVFGVLVGISRNCPNISSLFSSRQDTACTKFAYFVRYSHLIRISVNYWRFDYHLQNEEYQ